MTRLSLILLGLVLIFGCRRSTENPRGANGPHSAAADADLFDYPKRGQAAVGAEEASGPKNSLAFKFKGFVHTKLDDWRAEFLITNHFSKDIVSAELTLHYQDEAGEEVRTWPWSLLHTRGWCEAGETIIDALGSLPPDKTTSVSVEVELIKFRDGTEWYGPFKYPKHGKAAVGMDEVAGPKNSVAIKFNRVVTLPGRQFGGRKGEFFITNHFSKDITGLSLDLHYLDKNGQEIDRGPQDISYGGSLIYCQAGETIIDALGSSVPENTAQIRVVVERVGFRDGTELKP